MSHEKSRKINHTLAWISLLLGGVLAVDGALQLVVGNTDRTGESLLGGLLAILSTVFFLAARTGRDVEPN